MGFMISIFGYYVEMFWRIELNGGEITTINTKRGQKVKYHKTSITKSISKIFKLNFACLLSNERYKTYKTGFSIGPLGHACPRDWDLGCWGGQKI